MTDSSLMDADCIHGNVWYECDECDRDILSVGSDAGEPDSQSSQEPQPKETAMLTQTTLRFYVSDMTRYASGMGTKINLKPAYNNGKGNEGWATATSSGEITLHVNNPSAVEWFEGCMDDKSDIHITMQRVPDLTE